MRQNILKVGTVIGLLLLIGILTSCEETTTNKKQEIINIAKKEEIVKKAIITPRKPIVFIAGYDNKNSHFYDSARVYFKDKNYQIINDAYSLEEIIIWMNNNVTKNPYGEVHIVNHNNPWKAMSLETTINGNKVTSKSLLSANLPKIKKGINSNSKIVFHSNGLGKKQELLNIFKQVFCVDEAPKVKASEYFNVFGGEFSNHFLAKPYYVFYPTAHSPGKVDLSKEIAKRYPKEKDINWFEALTNERERYIGEPYTKQFNVPIKWELDYHNSDDEIPTFTMQEELMDYVANIDDLMKDINKMDIPLEKFRWSYTRKNNKLIIKGRASVLCVLKPLTKPYGDLEHIKPDSNNKRLYAMK